eukprot:CAMPEP_0201512738 /NCGR_PEP_ID=MMETSP0161_2-20130828/4940_1 /ASSEMBLY_ACC=CAM_ASM_000251 /TAXON_ID=180227 /ORGANISM="Neoparamoeba aestuarina, Strain SoJaBio B1-5/56/2" /LENGTH=342 /DNA_ID=CAMNT_0047908699 /DNA_START=27 /DNA_END=1052 /DNA_ORIENTATION=-
MAEEPSVHHGLQYVLIPADPSTPLKACVLKGKSERELKREIEKYFQSFGITEGQKQDYQRKVMEQGLQKISQQAKADGSQAENVAETANMFNNYLNERLTQFEIVPVVMPTRANGYVARSLYIDEVGRYKELPLNDRASRLSQRDIRGDCFLLSNRDDPSIESWARLDTTVEETNALIECPPAYQPDPMSAEGQASAMANMKNKSDTTILTAEKVSDVIKGKSAANDLFKKESYADAAMKYTELLDELSGRDDSLSEEDRAQLIDLRGSLLINRALCHFNLDQLTLSRDDSREAAELGHRLKAYVVWIKSCLKMNAFAEGQAAIHLALEKHPEDGSILNLEK